MKKIITCVLIAFAIALVIPSLATAQNDAPKTTPAATAEKVTESPSASKPAQPEAKVEEGQNNAVAETVEETETGNNEAVEATEGQAEEQIDEQAEENAEEEAEEKADAPKSGSGWLKYLLAMLAISGLCSGAVFFILNKRIDELNRIIRSENQASQRMINQRLDNLVVKTDRIETSVGSVRQDIRNRTATVGAAPVTGYPISQNTPSAQPPQVNRPTQFYLGMPGTDGSWSDVSTTNKPGQCLYVINSQDGLSGTFKVINEPVAVQSILMAVGKYLSPVCRVTNTATQVSGIVTDEPGVAVNDNGVWRMTKKAVVHYV